jgi:hypothetical protein
VLSLNHRKFAEPNRLSALALEIGEVIEDSEVIFRGKLNLFSLAVEQGDREMADRLWNDLGGMGRVWDRAIYRPGGVEAVRVQDLLYRGELTEGVLAHAEALARGGRNRAAIQQLHCLRGEWHLGRDEPEQAVQSLAEAVRMARERGGEDVHSEALHAIARLRAGESFDACGEAERLSESESGSVALAELWYELDERDRAVEEALSVHSWAVAEGEPYVLRDYLDRARKILTDLKEPLPEVSRHDPSKAKPYHWEEDVRAFIDKLKAERRAEQNAKKARSRPRKRKE